MSRTINLLLALLLLLICPNIIMADRIVNASLAAGCEENDYCPAWSLSTIKQDGLNTSECSCQSNALIHCQENHDIYLTSSACVTYDSDLHSAIAGHCPFNAHKVHYGKQISVHISAVNMNLTKVMCEPLNRTGLLCSHCIEGLGPALLNYSYPCLECSRLGWVAYFLATLIPSTIFFLVILCFRVDILSPSMNYFIYHSQMFTFLVHRVPNSILSTYPQFTKLLVTFYGIWNLEFFRAYIPSFCVSREMNMRTVVALEYIVALYPLLLTALIHAAIEMHARGFRPLLVLWRPFHQCSHDCRKIGSIRGSIINVFASFLYLSYNKNLATSLTLLSFVHPRANNNFTVVSKKTSLMFVNASVSISEAIPQFILSISVSSIFCILPLCLLFAYQLKVFRKCIYKFPLLREVI